MWAKLPYRQKIKVLGVAAVLLLIICYKFSISRTVAEYRLYRENRQSTMQLSATGPSTQSLEDKEKNLSGLLDQFVLDTLNNSKNLLSIVGNYCNNHKLILKEYLPYAGSPADSFPVLTRHVVIEGAYVDCLRLVYELETRYRSGKVSSVLFKSFTDVNTDKTHLYCTIFIQNLITALYEKK